MEKIRKSPGLSVNAIKIVALLAMTIDHIGAYGRNFPLVEENYVLIRSIGRIAAPLFLFAFVEALRHTGSRRRLLSRLYSASLATGIVNAVLGYRLQYSFGNIFQTFAWTGALVFCTERLREKGEWGALIKLLAAAAAAFVLDKFICSGYFEFKHAALVRELIRAFINSPAKVEYSLGMIALGAVWYYMPSKNHCALLLFLLCIPAGLGWSDYTGSLVMFSGIQYCMAGAVPFIFAYNGERGRNMGRFFYIYYPVHVWLIAVINKIM